MNEGAFFDSINKCNSFLKKLDVLQKVNHINIKKSSIHKFSRDFIETCRSKTYEDMYKCAMENDDYDFLLKDGSFFQFSIDVDKSGENVRLAYYPSICQISYSQFLRDELDVVYEEVGDEFIELYHQFVIEQIPDAVTPLRYDYNERIYTEMIHSAAHLHFGHEENIRVPINKKMKPLLFVKLVTEYYFYEQWKILISDRRDEILCAGEDFEEINTSFFSSDDQRIPYIHVSDKRV